MSNPSSNYTFFNRYSHFFTEQEILKERQKCIGIMTKARHTASLIRDSITWRDVDTILSEAIREMNEK